MKNNINKNNNTEKCAGAKASSACIVRQRRIDEIALEVMQEWGRECCWYGDPPLLHEIYDRYNGKARHPLNIFAAVNGALARSKKFKRDGYITHLGRKYPVFVAA